MRTLDRSALMPFAAAELYGLVADVASYPEFLPGCVSAQIDSEQVLDDGQRLVRARLGFRVSALSDSFATENRMRAGERIEMRLLEGPFRKLEGVWDFKVLDERACKVSLGLTVDFASRIMEATLAPAMDRAVNGIIEAFRQRAEQRLVRG